MKRDALIELLISSRENFLELLEGLTDEDLARSKVNDAWSILDILAHLTRWEAELVKLLWQANQGQKPTSAQFSRLSIDEINRKWFAEMKSRPAFSVLEDFHGVRTQTIRRLEVFTDSDLNEINRFSWLGGKALWEWVAADSFEHESEHAEQIRAWRKGTHHQQGE